METELENLRLFLTSPRMRKPGTLTSYLQTGKTFLAWLHGDKMPTGEEEEAKREAGLIFRRYFLYRRDKGISERTLAKEFAQLRKLATSNDWPWPFIADDKPLPEEEAYQPAFTPEEIQQIIEARDKYSKGELFYLAVSTTWGSRREEMITIRKRDYNEQTLKIKIAKQKKPTPPVVHLIPDVIRPILLNYHPKLTNSNSLSYMFYRILANAGLPQRKGYGWHSFRRSLRTILEWNLAEAKLPLSLVADFMGWSKQQKGLVYGGSPMLGLYAHPEILSSDPFAVEKLILAVHPFLPLWVDGEKQATGHEKTIEHERAIIQE